MGRERAERIRQFILSNLTSEFTDIGRAVVAEFNAPRQAVYKQLRRLEERGLIEGRGRTNAKEYRLKTVEHRTVRPIEGLEEYQLWEEFALPFLKDLPESVLGICSYGFTEMVNNVIDHSGSSNASVDTQNRPLMDT